MDEPPISWEAHAGLPRQAPGSDATTRHLLALAAPPPAAEVLDIGCGPGRASLRIAATLPEARVTAVDLHQPFLDELDLAARAAGVADRITTVRASMLELPFEDASFDLLWSEGAVYVMGFEAGLTGWRRLLRPGGTLVVTEATWCTEDPSPRARAFWADAYPAMVDVAANERMARAAGYDVVATFRLPNADWWEEYYTPLEARLRGLAAAASDAGRELGPDVAIELEEIDLHRHHGDEYGYIGFVLRQID